MALRLHELAQRIGAEVRNVAASSDPVIDRCARLEEAGPSEVAFIANKKYLSHLKSTQAGAVIVSPDHDDGQRPLLVADDPYFAFRNAVVELHGFREHSTPHDGPISSQAIVDPGAEIGEGTLIHPFAVISRGVKIGRNCIIYPHTYIGPETTLGDECVLFPNVVVYDRCEIRHRVTLHAGCVIGQDGFGYATHDGAHHKIPQVGNVVIEDDVEMGAGCAIDRATLGSTVIGRGTKFSDLIAIGHGTRVGRHNLLVALVGLAGSVETGDYVAMGGQVGVAGHLRIGHQVQIAATSGVMSDVPDHQQTGGTPAAPLNDAKRIHLHTQRLPETVQRLKQLEREVAELRRQLKQEPEQKE